MSSDRATGDLSQGIPRLSVGTNQGSSGPTLLSSRRDAGFGVAFFVCLTLVVTRDA
jgi:hypothetical protein